MPWPPITMATQHPDNAGTPWWCQDPFIPTQDEIDELLLLFQTLPIDEYMWDWEGKYVDEAVGEKLFGRAAAFFREHPLGEDFYLTYRIPAFWNDGRMHRMARAFMNILSLADFARDIQLVRPPVTEMFLPLVTSAMQPLAVRKAFREVASYHRVVFHVDERRGEELLRHVEVTPLIEDVDSLFTIDAIVKPYWEALLSERPEMRERGQRVFLARSDPALNSGLVPAVLAVKVALNLCHEVGESLQLPVFPILGTGSLPFRGSVNPSYVETFLAQYAGTRTYSIQSAFRYDYPLEDVRTALMRIRTEAPEREVVRIGPQERRRLRSLADLFEGVWKPTIEALAPLINYIAEYVPARRERLLHIGLFGYSRGVGSVKLPRAIPFTAALYSIGVPPEIIGMGRGLRGVRFREELSLLDSYYPALREDLKHAGKYLNRENLSILAREGWPAGRSLGEGRSHAGTSVPASIFQGVQEDVALIEEILGVTLSPEKSHHLIHRNLTSTIYQWLRSSTTDPAILQRDIVEAGKIRRSLG